MRIHTAALSPVSVVFLLLLAGCGGGFGPRIQGTGPVVSQTRTIGAFSGVDLRSDADVVISQGDRPEVKVEAQQNILDVLKTAVHGETLRIEYDHVNVVDHEPVKVYLTTPTLSEVSLSGTGSVTSDVSWRADAFRADISGSGDVGLRVTGAKDLRAEISGSGNLDLQTLGVNDLHMGISGSGGVRLAGEAASVKLDISGSGHVRAYDLTARDVRVHISGSGSAAVNAADRLTGDISGAGSVRYRGRPVVTCRISGAGSVNPEK